MVTMFDAKTGEDVGSASCKIQTLEQTLLKWGDIVTLRFKNVIVLPISVCISVHLAKYAMFT